MFRFTFRFCALFACFVLLVYAIPDRVHAYEPDFQSDFPTVEYGEAHPGPSFSPDSVSNPEPPVPEPFPDDELPGARPGIDETGPTRPEIHARPKPPQSLSIFIAGDVCPAYRISGTHWDSPGFFTARAARFISSHDLSVMNYETATEHTNAVERQKRFVFRASPESPRGCAMFDVAVTANNHAFDLAEKGWTETERALGAADILHTGVFERSVGYEPLRMKKKDIPVVLVAGTIWGSSFGRFATLSPPEIEKTVSQERRNAPDAFVVVYIHGDREYEKKTASQEKWSRRFSDAGANLVLWAHSHVYGPTERIGETTVAYGLGNFLFGGNGKWRNKDDVLGFSATYVPGSAPFVKPVGFVSRNYVLDCAEECAPPARNGDAP